MVDRRFYAIASVIVLLTAAGCLGGTGTGGDTGTFNVLVSDQEADIGDFTSLNVTIDEIRVQPQNTSKDPMTVTLDEPRTVDMTTVIGDRAAAILQTELPTGNYSKVELFVVDQFDSPGNVRKTPGVVTQAVVDSDEGAKRFVTERDVQVMVPSGKLQVEKDFTIAPNTTVDFVFDIHVVLKGATGEYNLQPNLAGSGVEGEDVPEQERTGPPPETGQPENTGAAQ